ncbi:MAG: PorT family protein [Bacteroidaceae bacterium]|nr:PorT family protein [Bacteroidaceae bacterium]
MTFHNRKYILVMILLTAFCMMLSAQERKVMNRPYIDQRTYHYGFFFGTHMQDLEFQNNGFTDEDGNQWFADVPNYDPGFSVGILGELRLHDNIALRAIPTMHFGQKVVRFQNARDNSHELLTNKSTYISVPVDLKFSAERFNNYRPYIMAGVNPMFDLTIKKQRNIKLKPFDVYLEAGIGCDFYLPFFKLIPEIKFCYGLMNVLDKKRTDLTDPTRLIYTNSLDNAHSKMIVLSLYFE